MTVDPNFVAGTLAGLLGITVFLVILYGPWQRLCTDYARDIIFEQREALFDIAASGRLAFGSEPYETIRSGLNALIRLAHRLTLFGMVLFILRSRRTEMRKPTTAMRAALSRIGQADTREEVSRLIARAEQAALEMLFLRSPGFVLFALLPFALIMAIRRGARRTLDGGKRALTGQIENAMSVEAHASAG